MLTVLTSFDDGLPLASLVISGSKRTYVPLYVKGTGVKLNKIEENVGSIRRIIENYPVMVNDFKSHVKAFGLSRRVDYEVFDAGLINPGPSREELDGCGFVSGNDRYRSLIANVSVVYQGLEDRGVFDGYKRVFPRYFLSTLSGRSKTVGYNIQGATSDLIRHINGGVFVHFDWVSADLLMVAVISGDNDLLSMFGESDPYSIISKSIGIDRSECKRAFFSALYSLDVDHPIFMLFPVLKKWIGDCVVKLDRDGYLESLLGRRFYLSGSNRLGVFNSQFQGSVVHALHNVMVKSFADYGYYLVTEIHDSLVFACNKSLLSSLIKDVGDMMLHPFDDLKLRMPFVVSVGTRWRHWRVFKTVR
jgi:hypothetical protein